MSMVKIVSPSGWEWDRPVALPLKLSSRGLVGNDRREFLKLASHVFLPYIDQIKVAKDEVPVHVIALGASEAYGCFTAGTPIAAEDGGYLSVEDLAVGDIVLSADGHGCEVSYLFRRQVDHTILLDVCGLADTLCCSPDHPFRVARREQFVCDHDKYKRCLPPTFASQNICNRTRETRKCVAAGYRAINWEWADAATVREGDFLIWTPPDMPPAFDIGPAEGYLLGAWLAEGSFQRNSSNKAVASIRLSIHAAEDVFADRIKECGAALGLTVNDYPEGDGRENCRVLTITGNPSRFRLWHATFREHAVAKVVPPWVCCLPRETRLAIIAGYIDGDGSCAVNDKENRVTVRSHGKDLSLGMQRLFWSVGVPAVRCQVTAGGWNLSAACPTLTDVAPLSWKIRGRELRQTTKVHGFCHEGRMYLPVRSVLLGGPAEVFNFEVAGDHTYSGPNVDSHNCNRNGDAFKEAACKNYHDTFVKFAKWYRNHKNKPANGDPNYGYVKQSAYNDAMRRVELICMLNAEKSAADRNGGLVADKELEKLAAGDDIAVSMACRVPYDECATCGNKARTREEYCKAASCPAGGCYDNLTRLVKVGADIQIVHVNNDHPTWFDMSNVFRPADRIAYGNRADYLQKVASADDDFFRGGGAKMAEDLGVTAPIEVLLASDLILPSAWTGALAEQVKLAHALALQEERMSGFGVSEEVKRAFDARVQGDIDISRMGEPGSAKCAEYLAALADRTITLPLRDFARLTKQAAHVAGAAQALTGVYGRMVADGSIERRVAANPFAVHGKTAGLAASTFAAEHKTALSLEKSAVDWRAKLSAVRGYPVPASNNAIWTEKQAADAPECDELARSYALYKLAALHRIAARGGDFLLTTLASAVQNQVV